MPYTSFNSLLSYIQRCQQANKARENLLDAMPQLRRLHEFIFQKILNPQPCTGLSRRRLGLHQGAAAAACTGSRLAISSCRPDKTKEPEERITKRGRTIICTKLYTRSIQPTLETKKRVIMKQQEGCNKALGFDAYLHGSQTLRLPLYMP